MNPIKTRYQVDDRKIVIFGAGKIGRSFIGQLFGRSGYKLVFIDVDPVITEMLNSRGSYRIVIKGEKDEEIIISNLTAIQASDKQMVSEAVSSAGILAVSVGKNALEKVIPVIADGLELRQNRNPGCPLDIIIAENMRDAADFMGDQLKKHLPPDYPVEKFVGLIETSIGKMVPIMTQDELEKDPLVIYAEPYNTLILDGKGFKSPIPDIEGLAPKNNIKAWVDRKAFIHNLGHATAAYYGHYLHPQMTYMYEVLEDKLVLDFTREVMMQSAEVLNKVYSEDLPMKDLADHVEDLLNRFRNRALQDTIFRVGHDLVRKLGSDDRFMGAISLARQCNMPYDLIVRAMSYGFRFKARNEEGLLFPDDENFLLSVSDNFNSVFTSILSYDSEKDQSVINQLYKLVNYL